MFLPYYRIAGCACCSTPPGAYGVAWQGICQVAGPRHYPAQRFNPYTDLQSGFVVLGWGGSNHSFDIRKPIGRLLYLLFKT